MKIGLGRLRLEGAWLCLWVACGPPVGEPTVDEAPPTAGPRFVELTGELGASVHLERAEVASVRTSGAVAAPAEVSVDEHFYALVDAPVPGRVVSLLAHVGDVVEPGTPLVELSSGDVGTLRSSLVAARARIAASEARLARQRTLVAEHLASTSDVERSETELADARAAEASALSGLRAADARGRTTGGRGGLIVRSPIAGTVLEHHAFPGEAAGEDDHLFEIASLDHLWLLAQVSERDAAQITAGTPARVTFASRPDDVRTLPVALVAARVGDTTRAVEVRVELENVGGGLRPGMTASVLFLPGGESSSSLLLVPRAAIQHGTAGWIVFVDHGEGRFEERPVLRGRDLGDDVEILDGLDAGETVVTRGSFLLRSIADSESLGEDE